MERLEPRHLLAAFVPDDPLYFPGPEFGASEGFYGQWHLVNRLPVEANLNAGVDAGLAGAWEAGLTGSGVTIGILDDGTEGDHPDLAAGFRNDLSWDFGASSGRNRASENRGGPVIDTLGSEGDNHGTAVAGVAAARGGNGIGTTGAAPQAGIAALRVLAKAFGRSQDAAEAAAIRYQGQTDRRGQPDPFAPVNWAAGVPVRVKNHSYGPENPFLASSRGTIVPALAESARHGVIHVASAGNERGTYPTADANKSELAADPNVITVAALGSDAVFADYSSYGANVFVTAPSSSSGRFAIATTDRAGFDLGYNLDPEFEDPFFAETADGNATSTFGGTSSAAPLVAGIMALGVEANPALDVRMAKHVLARTSRVVDAGSPSWTTNAAGLNFSENYGFGLIDAAAFTSRVREVTAVSPLVSHASPAVRVNAGFTPTRTVLTKSYTVPAGATTAPLETVRVTLNVANLQSNIRTYRNGAGSGRGAISGDLEAHVTSPSGTRYRLFADDRFLVGGEDQANRYGEPGARPRSTLNWTFTSNAFWGETATGTWTVELANKAAASQLRSLAGTWRNVSFRFDTGSISLGESTTQAAATGGSGGGATPAPTATVRVAANSFAAYGLAWNPAHASATALAEHGPRPRRGRG